MRRDLEFQEEVSLLPSPSPPLIIADETFYLEFNDQNDIVILTTGVEDYIRTKSKFFPMAWFVDEVFYQKNINFSEVVDIWGFKHRKVILVPSIKDAASFKAGGELLEARYNQAERMLSGWGALVKRVDFAMTVEFLDGLRETVNIDFYLMIVFGKSIFSDKRSRAEDADKITPMGFTENRGKIKYHFFSTYTNRELIITQQNMNSNGFEELSKNAPLSYWTELNLQPMYRVLDKKEQKEAMVKIETYMRGLSDHCIQTGVKKNYQILRHGAWNLKHENGRNERVYHLGSELLNEKLKKKPFGIVDEEYLLFACNGIGKLYRQPLIKEEMIEFEKFLTLREWFEPAAPILLLGSIYAGCLSGILGWRPHLWINAPFATGKSAISDAFKDLLGDGKGCFYAAGDKTTESGIRRGTDGKAFLVIFEEAEGETTDALDQIILLARSSSDGKPIKQTNKDTHEEDVFTCYCMFIMFSIGNNLHRAADQSRFITLNLKKFESDAKKIFKEIDAVKKKFWTLRMGRRIHYDAYLNADKFIELTLEIKARMGGGRHAANLAPLLAGYMMLKKEESMEYLDELVKKVENIGDADIEEGPLAIYKKYNYKPIDPDVSNFRDTLLMQDFTIEYLGYKYTKTLGAWILFLMDKHTPEEQIIVNNKTKIHEKLQDKGVRINIGTLKQWEVYILLASPVLGFACKVPGMKNKIKTIVITLKGEYGKTLRINKYSIGKGLTIPLYSLFPEMDEDE